MYSQEAEQYISKEFPSLQDNCYLDHTGATLYAKSQIEAVTKDLCENIYGNPHSLSLSSRYCTDVVDQVRYRILQHFNTNPEEYSVIFTSGATGALKLLAESFDWKGENGIENKANQKGTILGPNAAQQENKGSYCLQFSTQTNQGEIKSLPAVEGDFKVFCTPDDPVEMIECSTEKYDGTCGKFVYLQDNHTSVLGMREVAADKGAQVQCISHEHAFKTFGNRDDPVERNSTLAYSGNSLFVYPAQCNFSGVKYPLWWVNKVQHGILDHFTSTEINDCNADPRRRQSKWFCVLDAATFVSTNHLDLSDVHPDFVCVSFYKIFGYPTGLGALLVRNSSADKLKKVYFGGGTVLISLSSEQFHISRPTLSDRFEDGTIPFLSIIALRHGFDALQRFTDAMSNVTLHTFFLARYVHHSLLLLHHINGSPAVKLYSDTDYEDFFTQGNIVNFNLLRSNKEYVGFVEVLNMANLHGIHLRTGCFCNPGACQRHLGLSVEELRSHFQAGHVCGDDRDLIAGQPTGSIRVSFGYMSTQGDADKFLDMISNCFIEGPMIVKVPSWWPGFRKKYRDKFALRSSKTVSVGLHNDLILCSTTSLVPPIDLEEHFTSEISNKTVEESQLNNTSDKRNANDIEASEICYSVTGHEKLSKMFKDFDDQLNLGRKEKTDNVSVCHEQVLPESYNSNTNNVEMIYEKRKEQAISLSHIFVYPVKSCGAMPVDRWRIGPRGLLYDREWMIVTPSGVSLTQKHDTKLCLIRPTIDLKKKKLFLVFEGLPSLCLPLDQPEEHSSSRKAFLCQSKVCGDRVQGWDCGDAAAAWLQEALGREGLRLIRQWHNDRRARKPGELRATADEGPSVLSLSNQAQFLLLNAASIHWLGDRLEEGANYSKEGLLERFRSNVVVQGTQPFVENEWTQLQIGNAKFVVEGPCTRCQMVCIDQATGERTREPLRTLAASFHGKMRFGIYLRHCCKELEMGISVGDLVTHIT